MPRAKQDQWEIEDVRLWPILRDVGEETRLQMLEG